MQGKHLFLSLLSIAMFQQSKAQQDKGNYVFGLEGQYGNVWVHTPKVESVRGSRPTTISFSMTKEYTNEELYQKWHFFARQGFQFSYTDFHKKVLGSAYSLSYKLQPIIPLNDRLNLLFTGNVGLAYLTNPYNANTNPTNQSYSENVNFFLRFSTGLEYNVSNHIGINLNADYNHISNGGLKQPNRGINYPTVSLGLLYHTKTNRLPHYVKEKDDSWKENNNIRSEFSIYYAPKDGYAKTSDTYNASAWKQKRKLLLGGNLQFSKRVSGINALNLGAEAYYDGAMSSIKENRGNQSSNVLVGLLAGNEFIIGKVLFSQQLGVYVYKNTAYLDTTYYNQNGQKSPYRTPLYQRYGLRYKITDHLLTGVSLLAHGRTADFFDFRIGYRL